MYPGVGRMLAGIGLAAVAGLLSFAGQSAAGPGETYIVWTGGMLVGGLWAVSGFIRWMRYETAVRRAGRSLYR